MNGFKLTIHSNETKEVFVETNQPKNIRLGLRICQAIGLPMTNLMVFEVLSNMKKAKLEDDSTEYQEVREQDLGLCSKWQNNGKIFVIRLD